MVSDSSDARAASLPGLGIPEDSTKGSPETSAESERKRPLWRRPNVVLIGLLVVAIALAGTFAILWITGSKTSPDEVGNYLSDQSPAVEKVATDVGSLLLNYSSTNIEDVGKQMLALATGNFADQYQKIVTSGKGLGSALQKSSASSRGQILQGPDVSFSSAGEAVALLRVTQTVQSSALPGGRTVSYFLKISLVSTPEGWKADNVEVLSQADTSGLPGA
ncbi:MAG: Mce-associated rane protein [Actinomycetota bacterium]|jgi:hypothetical protein|nr:Mce-associated rane protein [Actinomycetota bacterium]